MEPVGQRVLVVDDEPIVREVLSRYLARDGYAVDTAEDGQAALEAFEKEPPDLILLDVMMPRMDGWEVLQRMQERHGVGAIPVLMFSGKVDEQAEREATARGARGFIGKPFDPQQLIERAKQMLPT